MYEVSRLKRTSAPVTLAIILASAAFGMFVAWQAPGVDRYTHDWLMRIRGPRPVSDEIALVAIDDKSVASRGRFPWPRTILANAIDAVARQHPRAIALDVLVADATDPVDDQALADAIGRAQSVVLGAQLVPADSYGGGSAWLRPLPLFLARAASVGHINVAAESDGSARQLLLEMSDDAGSIVSAMPVEAFRVGNRIPASAIVSGLAEFAIGPKEIPVQASGNEIRGSATVYRASRMTIDYAGPAGAFAAHEYSISDLLGDRLPPGALQEKYVLIGATAASLGERFTSPFTGYPDRQGNQHGVSMPGVEVLANALNTILSGRFYKETPAAAAFICCALSSWLMLLLLTLAQGRNGMLRHAAALAGGVLLILLAGYGLFGVLLLFPPLAAMLVSATAAGLSGLGFRSVTASAALDRGIRTSLDSLETFGALPSPDRVAESIERLTGAAGVLLVKSGRVVGASGYPAPRPAGVPDAGALTQDTGISKIPVGSDGLLVLLQRASAPPSQRAVRLAECLAAACLEDWKTTESSRGLLPEDLEEKAGQMNRLNERIVRQARFFHSTVRSVDDGLLIADCDGRIRFANIRAAYIFGSTPEGLTGRDLCGVLELPEAPPGASNAELLEALIVNRQTIAREFSRGASRYLLRLAPVLREESSVPLGIVASIADITRQYELAQTRSDVIALVSHEMRTPLTAIQGMTELLANYDIEPGKRREMTQAIHEEVKRLARMIGDYLDIARLEMGKTTLRRAPVRIEALLDRALLLFEPTAEEKFIRIRRNFDAGIPAILADPDLLSRVFTNLISNAVKYSPSHTEVTVTLTTRENQVVIAFEDQGYGIPPADLDRIFEKFYRVPRLEDADVPGTGLGLTFVRDIVQLHGGTVTVRSAPGQGSSFRVQLPSGKSDEAG
ncbi:MAG: CHASE2 domain-containing protein [Acidobacteriota bacterium]|nr:CHASE2 domain-containing protein [Acidobacteriota bacterium]